MGNDTLKLHSRRYGNEGLQQRLDRAELARMLGEFCRSLGLTLDYGAPSHVAAINKFLDAVIEELRHGR